MNAHHLALALALGFAAPAAADCRWEWLCNGDGACKKMPVCGSLYESPPPRPDESKPPAIPPLTMRVNTFSGRGVPPPQLDSDEAVLRYVRARRGAIGYVSQAAATSGVKVIGVR